jgi:inner membrane transporter RhtA
VEAAPEIHMMRRTMPPPPPLAFPILPLLALLGAMLSLSVGTSMAKGLFPAVGPAGVTLLRVATATAILTAVWRPWRRGVAGKDWPTLAGYGASIGAMNLLFYEAVGRLPYGVAVAFEFCGPLAVAVVAARRPADFAWVALAVAGLALLLPVGPGTGRLDPAGVGFAVGAGACWAAYILLGARAGRRLHGGRVTAVGMAVATLVVAPFGVARGGAALAEPWPLLVGAGVGLMSGAVPFGLEMYALARLPRRTFSVLLSMEPAVAAVAGWAMLGEHLTRTEALAIACVVAASVGSAANAGRDPPPPTVD